MSEDNKDIDDIIAHLQQISESPEDMAELQRYAERHATPTITLLEELKAWRDKAEGERAGTRRIIVEGFDAESDHAAFTDAMKKASGYFDEKHDTHVSVLGIVHLPKGGYHVTLEVLISPMSLTKTMKVEGADVELKHIHDHDYTKRKKHEEVHLKEVVQDHFLQISGLNPDIPDYILINIHDAEILNYMIEKHFFKAGHKNDPLPTLGPTIVQTRKPNPDGDDELS